MKLHLACHGGIANLRIRGQVDTAELPGDLAEKVERVLGARRRMRAAGAAPKDPRMTDAQQYEVTVQPEGVGAPRTYQLDESSLSDEELEVLDELRGEIVRRMAAKR
ncbi:MAG TPA: protealysin inhibitor emfourin [Thermoanaerobaculia bacterium]|jgi:hypothetical protein